MKCNLPDSAATEALGARLAITRPSSAVVHLHGDLGAGKSTLARAMLRAMGVAGAIKSPTYTLVERYPLDDGREAAHLDLYRIGQSGELDFLGLDELADSVSLWLVEWPERGAGHLPVPDITLSLEMDGPGRLAVLSPESPKGAAWIERLDWGKQQK